MECTIFNRFLGCGQQIPIDNKGLTPERSQTAFFEGLEAFFICFSGGWKYVWT